MSTELRLWIIFHRRIDRNRILKLDSYWEKKDYATEVKFFYREVTMKRVLLSLALVVLIASGYAYWTDIFANYYIPPETFIPVAARIYRNGVYTGYTTPHRFEPNTVYHGTYTVELEQYGPWGPTSAYVAPTAENGVVIFSSSYGPTVPIELSSFTAAISANNCINLTWVTHSETGVRGYYVLRNNTNELTMATTISGFIPATNTSQTVSYFYTDEDLEDEGTYYYWLLNSDLDGQDYYYGPSSIQYSLPGDDIPEPPQTTSLGPIYPNPFNPNAVIPINLKNDSTVSLKIYNNRGQEVRRFDLGNLQAGNHQISWDGRDGSGQPLASGVYQIRMQTGKDNYQVKAVLMK